MRCLIDVSAARKSLAFVCVCATCIGRRLSTPINKRALSLQKRETFCSTISRLCVCRLAIEDLDRWDLVRVRHRQASLCRLLAAITTTSTAAAAAFCVFSALGATWLKSELDCWRKSTNTLCVCVGLPSLLAWASSSSSWLLVSVSRVVSFIVPSVVWACTHTHKFIRLFSRWVGNVQVLSGCVCLCLVLSTSSLQSSKLWASSLTWKQPFDSSTHASLKL